ncbi:Asp-tRNA(Asn)/Glu-tRNA(Gln) amidotransferase subunit GatC [Alienimonas sp. DA493]|uniref:Asp-tRNA(Asn)/Glu-tRNA(Gln) amidotransferase subunit GatC n=1 Tax=Alienimonas sp. DA493 TaxID=3373605 RepID=UPI0037543A13
MASPANPQITRKEVARVAKLSRLALKPNELNAFTAQLRAILGYVHLLDEVDTADVEPMAHAIDVRDVLREDVPTPMLPREAALANAPASDGECFLVPQILGGE